MSKTSFNLPTQKGTELWPQQTGIPAVVRFTNFGANEPEKFMFSYGAKVRQFHQAQAQNHSLSVNQSSRAFAVLDNRYKLTYTVQQGSEFVDIEQYPEELISPPVEPIVPEPEKDSTLPFVFIGVRSLPGKEKYIAPSLWQKVGSNDEKILFFWDNSDDFASVPKVDTTSVGESGRNTLAIELADKSGKGMIGLRADFEGASDPIIDPVDEEVWDFAFVWDPLDEAGLNLDSILNDFGYDDQEKRQALYYAGPQGRYVVKISASRPHCERVSAAGEYIVILGKNDKRQILRGNFDIESSSDFGYLSFPLGYTSENQIQNLPRRGGCSPIVLDNGDNPHWKNWWQGALIIDAAPALYNISKQLASAGAISEEKFYIPPTGFNPGAGPDPENYALYCTPCPWKAVYVYQRSGTGVADAGYYQVSSEDILTPEGQCPVIGAPPTRREVVFRFGNFSYTRQFSILDFLLLAYEEAVENFPELELQTSAAQIADSFPATLPISGPIKSIHKGDNTGELFPRIQVPTRTTNWIWEETSPPPGTPPPEPRHSIVADVKVGCVDDIGFFSRETPTPFSVPNVLVYGPRHIYAPAIPALDQAQARDKTIDIQVSEAASSTAIIDFPTKDGTTAQFQCRWRYDFVSRTVLSLNNNDELDADRARILAENDPDVAILSF